jgi:diacylglycerol kinase
MRTRYRTFIKSLGHALTGIRTAWTYEFNMRIHCILALVAFLTGLYLKLSRTEWLVLCLTITLVIFAELMNTALEANVDLVTKEHRPEAKLAKDVAAGAVLVTSLNALVVAWIIFGLRLFPEL